MRAIVIVPGADGPTLDLREVPDPVAGPDDLLIAVKVAGLNRADLARTQQHYAASGGADIAGLEAAGEVVAVGANVTGFAPGDRVMAMCRDAYAERVAVDHRLALKVPDGLSWPEAATLPTWFLTAHDALVVNGRMASGESVLVQAVASGVGLAMLQVAKVMGAGLVIGTSRDAGKLARLKEFGLDVAIDTTREDFAAATRAATADKGADVILDTVGASVLAGNMQAAAILGRIVGIGRMGGKVAEIDLDLLALKRIALVGVTFRTRSLAEKAEVGRRMIADLGPHLAAGRLKPLVDRVFPLDGALDAQAYMKSNRHLGKIVLEL